MWWLNTSDNYMSMYNYMYNFHDNIMIGFKYSIAYIYVLIGLKQISLFSEFLYDFQSDELFFRKMFVIDRQLLKVN